MAYFDDPSQAKEVIVLATSAEKDAAVSAAISSGIGSLTPNQLTAFNAAKKDMTRTGDQANNIAEGRPPGESRRGFFGI